MQRQKWFRIIIYIMLFAMIASTVCHRALPCGLSYRSVEVNNSGQGFPCRYLACPATQ
jgi:hypothetical protein